MKNSLFRYIVLLLFVGMCGYRISAQQNNTLFFMHDAPQSNIVNPAIPINCDLFIAVPVLGSTHLNMYNTAVSINDMIKNIGGDTIAVDLDNGMTKLNGLDLMGTEAHFTLFSGGIRRNNAYYTFSVTEKINSLSAVPKEPTLLFWNGNSNYLDQRVDLSGYQFNFFHLRQYAFGFSNNISDNFRLGGRISLLFGKSNVNTQKAQGTFYTSSNAFETNLNLDARINSSLPIDVGVDTAGIVNSVSLRDDFNTLKYLLNGKNMGVGLDLGFVYQVNDVLQLSGSILNLGVVRWKSDVHNFNSNGSIDIVGSGNTNNLNTADYVTSWVDSIKSVFGLRPVEEAYFTTLTPEIYLGGTYNLNDRINAGALVHAQFYKNRIHPSLTLSGNAYITSYFSGSVSYTLQNREYNNVGAGLSLRLGAVQLHAMADNLPGLIWFEDAQNVNIRFGMSMLFGCSNGIFGNRNKDCNCVGDPYGEYRSNTRPGKRR